MLRVINEAEHKRHCLMISEEVPQNWEKTVAFVLEVLDGI